MADRKCSCCGEYYTDETGHNYDICITDCKAQLHKNINNLIDASYNLQKAYQRQIALLKEQVKNYTDNSK